MTGEEIYKDSDLRDLRIYRTQRNGIIQYISQTNEYLQQKIKGKRAGIFNEGILDWHGNLNGLKEQTV